jgi:hypothetical protein
VRQEVGACQFGLRLQWGKSGHHRHSNRHFRLSPGYRFVLDGSKVKRRGRSALCQLLPSDPDPHFQEWFELHTSIWGIIGLKADYSFVMEFSKLGGAIAFVQNSIIVVRLGICGTQIQS